jgi:hypothetical protein
LKANASETGSHLFNCEPEIAELHSHQGKKRFNISLYLSLKAAKKPSIARLGTPVRQDFSRITQPSYSVVDERGEV